MRHFSPELNYERADESLANILQHCTVIVQDEVEISNFLRHMLNGARVKHLSAWLWDVACDCKPPSRIQRFLSTYRTAEMSSAASCAKLINAYDFCAQHGYPLQCIKGAPLKNIKDTLNSPLNENYFANLFMPSIQNCIHDYLSNNLSRFVFLDFFPNARDPLLNVMRQEFAAMQTIHPIVKRVGAKSLAGFHETSLIESQAPSCTKHTDQAEHRSNEATNFLRLGLIRMAEDQKNPHVSGIKFKTLNDETHWIVEKIKASRINFPNARIAVISGNNAILQKIKAEMRGIPYVDRHMLCQTTLGMLIYDMAAHCNKDKLESLATSEESYLFSNELSVEDMIFAHKKIVMNELENSDVLDQLQNSGGKIEIAKDFFDTIVGSWQGDAEKASRLHVSVPEYQQLIRELLSMYFIESQFGEGANPILFKTPAFMFDAYDIAFLPSMNNETWIPKSRELPITGEIASNFYEDYSAPTEYYILESILNSDCVHVYVTCNESESPHSCLLNFPWTYNPTLEIPNERCKQTAKTAKFVHVPLSARPKSFSVADLQLLMDEPYSFYVKRILGLRPKENEDRAASVYSLVRDLLREYFARNKEQYTHLHDFASHWIEQNSVAPQFIPKLSIIIQGLSRDFAQKRANGVQMIGDYKMRMTVTIRNIDYVIYGVADRVDLYPKSLISEAFDLEGSTIAENHIVSYEIAPSKVSIQKFRNIVLPLKAFMFIRSAERLGRQILSPPTLEFAPFGEFATHIDNSEELMHGIENTVHQVLESYSDESFAFNTKSTKHTHLSRI
ncbi:MAG: hypothetical protein LBJ89_04575 [Holosporales bacterium]|jgi:hypothetical protein|nr:hypothetical protein [Holosporales bacterium]